MTTSTETLIVGAGPAGLAIAGRLSRLGLPYLILEASQHIAHSWHNHYSRLHLHTVKELSHLPHVPMPSNFPRYVPREQLVGYYEDYAKRMDIQPKFGQEVQEIQKLGEQWQVRSSTGETYFAQQVVIATGFNRQVNHPSWPGMETFTGELLHSRDYRDGAAYEGKRVLVVGMGNTGAEIALDLYEHGAKPVISVRSPVNIILRDPMGRPVQKSALLLNKLPPKWADRIGRYIQEKTVGDLSRHGLQQPKMAPLRQICETGQTPVIDVGTVEQIKAGRIRIYPAVERFTERDVVFVSGREVAFGAVILATGYRAAIEGFLTDTNGVFDPRGYPKGWQVATQPGLYFLGFDTYRPGGLLKVIREDSAFIAEAIQQRQATHATVS